MKTRNIGDEIIAGLEEFRKRPASLVRHRYEPTDVKAVREQFRMSQNQFADILMISVRTLQKWEQGERTPDGAAYALLRIMEREPEAVLRALQN